MPVGMAMMPKPNVITTEASNRPEDEGVVGLDHRSNRFQAWPAGVVAGCGRFTSP